MYTIPVMSRSETRSRVQGYMKLLCRIDLINKVNAFLVDKLFYPPYLFLWDRNSSSFSRLIQIWRTRFVVLVRAVLKWSRTWSFVPNHNSLYLFTLRLYNVYNSLYFGKFNKPLEQFSIGWQFDNFIRTHICTTFPFYLLKGHNKTHTRIQETYKYLELNFVSTS